MVSAKFPQDKAGEEGVAYRTHTAAAFVLLAATGCAHLEVSTDGTRRVIGFVNLEIPASDPGGHIAGEALHLRSLGILVTKTAVEGSLTIGYADTVHTIVRADSCVALRRSGP